MEQPVENTCSYRLPRQAIKDIFQILIRDDQRNYATLPPPLENNIQSVKIAHPEAAHHLFSGSEIRSFIADCFDADVLAAYDSLTPYAFKADLARYCLLFVHGGLYVDLGTRFLRRLEPPLGIGFAAFRYFNLLSGPPWCVSNNIIFASAGRPELRTAIDLLVQNCKNRYYGSTARDPTGPNLLGRAMAICNNGLDYWIGDSRMTTPEFNNRNITYITPDGTLLALRTNSISGNELEIDGTNNYSNLWRMQQVYGESTRIRCFGITRMHTNAAVRMPDSFLIERGACGHAIYGPYIPLAAGRYTINLCFDPATEFGNSRLDVCASVGGKIVIIKTFEAGGFEMNNDGCVGFELEAASNLQNVEVRMYVTGDCEGRFLKLEIIERE
jgi:hypothetical protein